MVREPSFEVVVTDDTDPGEALVMGTAGMGVAGLTATDYLVSHVDIHEFGHVSTRNLPDITPFAGGEPRHPMRLYSADDVDITVLVSELFLPVGVADPLADALFDWTETAGIEECTVLYGTGFPHEEEEHRVFHVATDAYRETHFTGADAAIDPLPGGFFDGVVAELLTRSLENAGPPVGVLVTPTHLPGPDLDAALRLLAPLERMYDVEVDEAELERQAAEMKAYYEELAGRMEQLQDGASDESREYPGDRMYM